MRKTVVCTKCGARWNIDYLDRRGKTACDSCDEPGLQYCDSKGNPTGETFPREPEYKMGKEGVK